MAKEILKITLFDKGLSNNSNPSALQEDELYQAQNVELSAKGTIKLPGKMNGVVNATTGETAGMDKSGSILGWASDYSMDTFVIYAPTALDTSLFVGKWATNNTHHTNATARGRVLAVENSVTYDSSTYDKIVVTRERNNNPEVDSVWAAGDSLYYTDTPRELSAPDSGQNISAVTPGQGQPESNKWLVHLDTNAELSLYSYNSATWFHKVIDLGGATAADGSIGIADQVLRVCDTTFDTDFVTASSSAWYGYVHHNMFQTDAIGTGTYKEGRWSAENLDLRSWSELGCYIAWVNGNSTNINSTITTNAGAGEHITIMYWGKKDESGLDAYGGGWAGVYEFGSAPIYDENQVGIIESISSITFSGHTLNLQVYVNLGTANPSTLVDKDNVWPGFGTSASKRVTGMQIYYRWPGETNWYILQTVDFLKGDDDSRWTTVEADAETSYGLDLGAMTLTVSNTTGHIHTKAYAVYSAADAVVQVHYALTYTTGWAGRTLYIKLRGWHYDPVYLPITDVAASDSTMIGVGITNPAEGSYTQWAELVDENYQTIMATASQSNDYIVANGPPPGHGPGGCCWVANEMWGYNDDRTHQARFYVINTNNWFTRLYKRYGETWGKVVRSRKWLQSILKPAWNYMSRQGKEFFDKPSGLDLIRDEVRDLNIKYPGLFQYYLIGSNARREKVTHYYDIQITPKSDEIDFHIWEDVLKTLYYTQEKDQRYANPNICPQFVYTKEYNGDEVYEHRDDMVDCYFYYDPKFPKNFALKNLMKNEKCENISGNLWLNKTPFIGEKWRQRGLDKLPYANREII
tara:strand:+ start:1838 stop:4252 length:2415 start_codon:yes stop_codon:yes gene_type:complete